jgi:hypothetical protein
MLCTVTGENKAFLSKTIIEISLGAYFFKYDMLITGVVQDYILGIDFMSSNKCDLIISKNFMTVKGDKIPCYMKNRTVSSCCSVSICENTIVDPNSEVSVQAKLLDHVDKDKLCLIKVSDYLSQKTGLIVTKVLVHTKSGTVPTRIASFSENAVELLKDTMTATLQTVQLVETEQVNEVNA